MKKRILSLIMAVCMVASLVPAMLLSVTAIDNTGFVTSFEFGGENWPNYDASATTAVANFNGFVGNWSVGTMTAGVYTESHYVDGGEKILSSNGSVWPNNVEDSVPGLYLGSGRNTLTNIWAPYYGTAPERVDGVETGNTVEGTKIAYVVTYTAPYEGKVDLSYIDAAAREDEIGSVPAGEVASMYMAVMVNDTMIWPTVGGDVTDPEDLALIESLASIKNYDEDLLKEVDVKYGDKIYFVCARYNTTFCLITPSVTYHDGFQIVPTSMVQTYSPSSPTWPSVRALSGISDLVQPDPQWSLGTYNPETDTFVVHGAQQRRLTDVWSGVDRENIDLNSKSGIMLKGSAQVYGAFIMGKTDVGNDVYPAYRVTALACGKGEISLNASSLFLGNANQQAAKSQMADIEIYKNGELLDTLTIMSDNAGVATCRGSVKNLQINKGDVYTFVAKSSDVSKVKYVTATPVLTYNSISSFMTEPTTEKYALALEDAAVVVDDAVGLQFKAYATIDTYRDATEANLYVWDASVSDKTLENATVVMPMTTEQDFAYNAIYNGFAPKEMVDEITAQVVVLKDGQAIASSEKATFTVAQKAQEQFNAALEEEDKKLMAAVMNYGAYAQKYFNYKTDNLANKDLEASYANINPSDPIYYAQLKDEAYATYLSNTEIDAFSLYLDSSLALRIYLDLDVYEAENFKMFVQHGDTETTCHGDRKGLAIDNESASALLEGISLKELSKVHYFRVAAESTSVRYYGLTITYSIESFAARMIDSEEENLPELVCALMELGKLVAED